MLHPPLSGGSPPRPARVLSLRVCGCELHARRHKTHWVPAPLTRAGCGSSAWGKSSGAVPAFNPVIFFSLGYTLECAGEMFVNLCIFISTCWRSCWKHLHDHIRACFFFKISFLPITPAPPVPHPLFHTCYYLSPLMLQYIIFLLIGVVRAL